MLVSKLCSGTSKTKARPGGLVRVALFWKSHCATCSPACARDILYHVTGSRKGPIKRENIMYLYILYVYLIGHSPLGLFRTNINKKWQINIQMNVTTFRIPTGRRQTSWLLMIQVALKPTAYSVLNNTADQLLWGYRSMSWTSWELLCRKLFHVAFLLNVLYV